MEALAPNDTVDPALYMGMKNISAMNPSGNQSNLYLAFENTMQLFMGLVLDATPDLIDPVKRREAGLETVKTLYPKVNGLMNELKNGKPVSRVEFIGHVKKMYDLLNPQHKAAGRGRAIIEAALDALNIPREELTRPAPTVSFKD